MEWIAFFTGLAALVVAVDSEAAARRLSRRISSLEEQLGKSRGSAATGSGSVGRESTG